MANVFLMLGAVPNTEWLRGAVVLDPSGFVRTGTAGGPTHDRHSRGPDLLETSQPGVFAVGDVPPPRDPLSSTHAHASRRTSGVPRARGQAVVPVSTHRAKTSIFSVGQVPSHGMLPSRSRARMASAWSRTSS